MLPNTTITTTLGELAAAFYDEALKELGDPALARDVSARLLTDFLHRRRLA